MDEHKIKRLLLLMLMAILVIMVAKYLLVKSVTNLGNAAIEKKHSAAPQASAPPAETPQVDTTDISAVSAVTEEVAASAAMEATTQ